MPAAPSADTKRNSLLTCSKERQEDGSVEGQLPLQSKAHIHTRTHTHIVELKKHQRIGFVVISSSAAVLKDYQTAEKEIRKKKHKLKLLLITVLIGIFKLSLFRAANE